MKSLVRFNWFRELQKQGLKCHYHIDYSQKYAHGNGKYYERQAIKKLPLINTR